MTRDPSAEPPMSNEALDAAISEAASLVSFADMLAARGETTVVMDEDGELVVHRPPEVAREGP